MSLLSAQLSDRRTLPRAASAQTLHLASPPASAVSLSLSLSRFVVAKRRPSDARAQPIEIPGENPAAHASPAASFLSLHSNASSTASNAWRNTSTTLYEEGDQFDEYTLMREIGHGAFSRVFEATNTCDPGGEATVAIKIIRKPNLSPPPSPVLNSLSHSMESLHIQRHISIPSLTLLQRHMEANDSLPNSPAHKSLRNTVSSSPAVSAYFHQQSVKLRSAQKLMDKETRIWASLSHQNILQIYDVMEVDDALCIVSELAKGGNLLDFLTTRGRIVDLDGVAKPMFRQLVEAVDYMHSTAGIVHRDLKLENIMVLEDWKNAGGELQNFIPTLKICDFGLSDFIHGDLHEVDEEEGEEDAVSPCSPCSSNASFGVGSLHYCSPEDLRGTVTPQNGAPSDIWALACILYAIVTGGLPFNDCFLPRLQMSILNGSFDEERLDRILSGGSKDKNPLYILLKGMFDVDVTKRLTLSQILESEWLKQ